MNWTEFVSQQGAHIDDRGYVQDFGTELEDLTGDLVCDLSSLALIRAAGADQVDFLHRQLTRDLRELPTGQAGLAAWCNAKGRVITSLLLYRDNDGTGLLVARNLKEAVLKRLRMFVLRADVTLTDCDDHVCIGVSGEQIHKSLGRLFSALPERPWHWRQQNGIIVIWVPGPVPRYLLLGENQAMQSLWIELSGSCRRAGPAAWTLLDIECGLPWIDAPLSEQFLPQMLNLDQLDALHFNKGCYPGQEVIARLHYRGEVKQRLRQGRTTVLPAPATPLYSDGGSRAGTTVNCAMHPDGNVHCLAVADPGAERLYLNASDGPAMELIASPSS